MKRNKLLWLILAVVAVAILAVGCGSKEEPKEEEPKEEVKEGVVTDFNNVVYIQFTDNETTITLKNISDAWFVNGDTSLFARQNDVNALVKAASQMEAIEEIKNVASLEEYGLENPVYTIILKDELEKTVTLYIGNVVGEEECYVTVGDKDKVYKVSKAIIDMLEFDENAWISPEDDPMERMKDQAAEEGLIPDEQESGDGAGGGETNDEESTITE